MRTCMSGHMCMHMNIHLYAQVCGGQRSTQSVFFNHNLYWFSKSPPYFFLWLVAFNWNYLHGCGSYWSNKKNNLLMTTQIRNTMSVIINCFWHLKEAWDLTSLSVFLKKGDSPRLVQFLYGYKLLMYIRERMGRSHTEGRIWKHSSLSLGSHILVASPFSMFLDTWKGWHRRLV